VYIAYCRTYMVIILIILYYLARSGSPTYRTNALIAVRKHIDSALAYTTSVVSPEDHGVSRCSGTVYADRGRDNAKYIIISNICLWIFNVPTTLQNPIYSELAVCAECIYIYIAGSTPTRAARVVLCCSSSSRSSSTLHSKIYNIVINHITPHATPAQPFYPRLGPLSDCPVFFLAPAVPPYAGRRKLIKNKFYVKPMATYVGLTSRYTGTLYTRHAYCSAWSVYYFVCARRLFFFIVIEF